MSNLGKKVLLYRTEISGKIPKVADIAVGELSPENSNISVLLLP